jgi:alkylhydroperoxidase/carboxymuconolactone decarboxylase family protein YurZ
VEAFDREKGWLAFDPTPASSQIMSQNPLFMRINNYLDAFEIFWSEWVVGYDEVIQGSLFRDLQQKSDLWTALGKRWLYEKAQTAKEKAFTLSRLKMIAFLLLTGTLGGMAYLLVIWIRGKQVLKKALHRGDVRGAIQFYEEFLKLLKSRGNVKPLYLTPNEFAASFEEKGIRERVEELTAIYNAVRFGRSQVTGPQIQRAVNVLAEIKTLCKAHRMYSLSHGERVARERRVREGVKKLLNRL